MSNFDLRLVTIYKSLKTDLQIGDIDTLLNTIKTVIIDGDLNAKHKDWHSWNKNSDIHYRLINVRNDTIIAAFTIPTRYPIDIRHRPDVLDIAIMKIG